MDINQQELISNTLALNVALQTMKERCLSLQKRLQTLEKENIRLKNPQNFNQNFESYSKKPANELVFLRAQNQDLMNQKMQLNEHLKMISKENRQLWGRLSQLTKEEPIITDQQSIEYFSRTSNGDYSKTNGSINNNTNNLSNTKSQLVRSTTFTLNSHPRLKERNQDVELEDISLDSYNENQQEMDSNKTFGFGFLQDSLNEDGSSDLENIKKVSDSFMYIRKELLKQQSDLKVTLTNWRKMKNPENCKVCKERAKIVKPAMIDKNVETDDLLDLDDDDSSLASDLDSTANQQIVIDFSEQIKRAGSVEKVCPMCGNLFDGGVSFEKFQEHVESHFLDNSDAERNPLDFELVSHSLGNF